MKSIRTTIALLLFVGIALGALQAVAEEKPDAAKPNPALLDPKLATDKAPDVYKVTMETTAGNFTIEVHREWAPNGADRFYNLVKIGYYDDMAFFRVIKGFMAQAGFHADPAVSQVWLNSRIKDDPVTQSNKPGMVTFAMSGQQALFDSRDAAIAFCDKHGLPYDVREPHKRKVRPKSYAENFSYYSVRGPGTTPLPRP